MKQLDYAKLLVRHGEVLLVPIFKKQLPKGLKLKDNVLAHGSVTGHSHILDGHAKVYLAPDGTQYVTVPDHPATLNHEEHKATPVQKGVYIVRIQRERDLNDEIHAVRD